jgi:hypothetical protein
MLHFLKNHPFAVEAFFESSLVLTFAVPKEQLQNLIPECLQPDTFQDRWGFVAVAMVQTRSLRPKGFPKFMGNDFFLVGYRVFVRYTNTRGKHLRGLYILRSQTNRKKMELFGNLFTHYNYTTTDISQKHMNGHYSVFSAGSRLSVDVELKDEATLSLPEGSPFANWKEARRFEGPLPFTFTCKPGEKKVLIIEGVRENWKPKPVQVNSYKIGFLETMNLSNAVLANAFMIKDIPYYWKRGKLESWSS